MLDCSALPLQELELRMLTSAVFHLEVVPDQLIAMDFSARLPPVTVQDSVSESSVMRRDSV